VAVAPFNSAHFQVRHYPQWWAWSYNWYNINKDPTRCNSMKSVLFYCKITTCFGCPPHPSSGVLNTVTAASGTGHNIGTATSLQRDLIGIRPHWREVAVPILWPVPEAAFTVFNTADDGCWDTRNMYSDFAVNKYLHTVASVGFLLTLNYDARKYELKMYCWVFLRGL